MKKRGYLPNPVYVHICELLATGKTTKEKICVTADLRYPTFDNMFFRPLVSIMIRKSLLHSGILPERIFNAYETWIRYVYKPATKDSNPTPRTADKAPRKTQGVAGDGGRGP